MDGLGVEYSIFSALVWAWTLAPHAFVQKMCRKIDPSIQTVALAPNIAQPVRW